MELRLSKIATLQPREGAVTSSLPTLSLAALGVVFGDIGTSPLYTLKTVLGLTGANPAGCGKKDPRCRTLKLNERATPVEDVGKARYR